MGADHGVDRFARPPRLFKLFEEAGLKHVPEGHVARLVVADASVDHQPQTRRIDQQCVDGKAHPAAFIDEMGLKPFDLAHGFGKGIRYRRLRAAAAQERRLRFQYPRDRHVTDTPSQHRILSSRCRQ